MATGLIFSKEGDGNVGPEYLSIERSHGPGVGRVEILQHEVIGEFSSRDEEGNLVEPPTEYEGHEVVGIENGYLLGNVLIPDDERTFYFEKGELEEVKRWIVEQGFELSPPVINELMRALGSE